MPDTAKPLFKLTTDTKYGFYTLHKWVHEEKNVYGEVRKWFRSATVWVRGIYTDSVPSIFTLEVDQNKPFEILGENVEGLEGDNLWDNVDVFVNQRRGTDTEHILDRETYNECELQLRNHGYDEGMLEDGGWKMVGYRIGFDDGKVEVEKVFEED